MRRALVALCVLALTPAKVGAQAADCTPRQLQLLTWTHNSATVYSDAVPAGEVWQLFRAGVASNDPTRLDVRMQIQEPVEAQANACCWLIPLASAEATSSTPRLSWGSDKDPQLMLPGQRIAVRLNGTLADLAVLGSGFKYPLACLSYLVIPAWATRSSSLAGALPSTPGPIAFRSGGTPQ